MTPAAALQIGIATLYRKLKSYGLIVGRGGAHNTLSLVATAPSALESRE